MKWKDVNLFENDFNKDIANLSFDGSLHLSTSALPTNLNNSNLLSPEFVTDGMLPKCWHKDEQGIYLKKGGTSLGINSGNEPISEYLVTQVLEVLEYPHVKYNLENYRGKLVSSCELITNKEVSMIPAFYLCSSYDILIQYCEENNFIDDLYRMFIFDFIICNSDRHLRNIGFLFNSDTYEILGLAPIYDNGVGMLSYYVIGDDLEQYLKDYTPRLYDSFEDKCKYFKAKLNIPHNIERLLEFQFTPHSSIFIDKIRLNFLSNFIRERARQFLGMVTFSNLYF